MWSYIKGRTAAESMRAKGDEKDKQTREEAAGRRKMCHNREFHDWYSSQY
jgi:hypothetical protein